MPFMDEATPLPYISSPLCNHSSYSPPSSTFESHLETPQITPQVSPTVINGFDDLHSIQAQNLQLIALLSHQPLDSSFPDSYSTPSAQHEPIDLSQLFFPPLAHVDNIQPTIPKPERPLPQDKNERRKELNRRASMRRRQRQLEELETLRQSARTGSQEKAAFRQEILMLRHENHLLRQENLLLRGQQGLDRLS